MSSWVGDGNGDRCAGKINKIGERGGGDETCAGRKWASTAAAANNRADGLRQHYVVRAAGEAHHGNAHHDEDEPVRAGISNMDVFCVKTVWPQTTGAGSADEPRVVVRLHASVETK